MVGMKEEGGWARRYFTTMMQGLQVTAPGSGREDDVVSSDFSLVCCQADAVNFVDFTEVTLTQ